jgi:hypothetical protein
LPELAIDRQIGDVIDCMNVAGQRLLSNPG